MPEAIATADEAQAAQPPSGRKTTRTVLVVGLIAAVVGAGVMTLGTRQGQGGTGRSEAPSFTLPSVEGGDDVSLSMRGDRPAVVNFFASWCAPCRRELPHFAAESRRLDGEVAFIGVAHQDDAELAAEMLEEFDIAYPAGNDPAGDVAREYSLRGMPSTAFVAADGTLLGVAAGEIDADQLRDWIEQLVAA